MDVLSNVNWLATVAGAVVAFLAGWAWYSEKMFGKGWADGSRVNLGSSDQMPVFAMVSQGDAKHHIERYPLALL
jgi:hypothetical protein